MRLRGRQRSGPFGQHKQRLLVAMSLTVSCISGDAQAAKACIAAAAADVPIKLQQTNADPTDALLLAPTGLTQPNAIAQYLGEGLPHLASDASNVLAG